MLLGQINLKLAVIIQSHESRNLTNELNIILLHRKCLK